MDERERIERDKLGQGVTPDQDEDDDDDQLDEDDEVERDFPIPNPPQA